MKPILTLYVLVFCMAAACNSTQKTTEDKAVDTAKIQMMLADGYVSAKVIMQPSQEGCPVVLKTENEYIDPINLQEDMKVDQMEVWVKFARLRRMNRCDMAGPVSITEIQKKAE